MMFQSPTRVTSIKLPFTAFWSRKVIQLFGRNSSGHRNAWQTSCPSRWHHRSWDPWSAPHPVAESIFVTYVFMHTDICVSLCICIYIYMYTHMYLCIQYKNAPVSFPVTHPYLQYGAPRYERVYWVAKPVTTQLGSGIHLDIMNGAEPHSPGNNPWSVWASPHVAAVVTKPRVLLWAGKKTGT